MTVNSTHRDSLCADRRIHSHKERLVVLRGNLKGMHGNLTVSETHLIKARRKLTHRYVTVQSSSHDREVKFQRELLIVEALCFQITTLTELCQMHELVRLDRHAKDSNRGGINEDGRIRTQLAPKVTYHHLHSRHSFCPVN
eukprot:XP_001705735.1 Hypothetical protein GL50803_31945 [Giardia lamblia ATCC 50803]